MKCVCGYEETEDNKSFIKIEFSNQITVQRRKEFAELEEVSLYACPECKTVKMRTWLD